MITRPMKASTVEIETMDKVRWPVLASPKIDGIRLLMHPELGAVTQSFKPLPNLYVRDYLEAQAHMSDLDGECYALDENGTAVFNLTQSLLMTRDGRPNFMYSVFDCFANPEEDYDQRYHRTENRVRMLNDSHINLLEHTTIHSMEHFLVFVEDCILKGFEGAVIRAHIAPYKSGKSTLNQNWMLKYKKWYDAEGTVIGFEELHHNDNAQEMDNLGLSKRSSHVEGKIPAGTLGALVLDTEWGVLRVGTGFDAATRKEIWLRNRPGELALLHGKPDLGRKVTFKYQKHGMLVLPRFPVFKWFRED